MTLVGVAAILSSAIALALNPPRPRAVIADPLFKFGAMPQKVNCKRTWVLKNDGNGLLRVGLAGFYGCEGSINLKKDEDLSIPPGGKSDLVVSWSTGRWNGPYRAGVFLQTNDSDMPNIDLVILGTVLPPDALPK